MITFIRAICRYLLVILLVACSPVAGMAGQAPDAVVQDWYRLVLELVRHTPTYSPPVASRAFAYMGVTVYEAAAAPNVKLVSLAGQLNGLTPAPARKAGQAYDEAVVVNAALAEAVTNFFSNTGPTGQRAIKAMTRKMRDKVRKGVSKKILAASQAHGKAVADHVLAWSLDDGGAVVENMGFPLQYTLQDGKAHWVPTSTIAQQQKPLLPGWGKNRTFAIPQGSTCDLPPPPAYSEEKSSQFYKEAEETYLAVKNLTKETKTIARFWSDDPMLSPTPPGHWISIALDISKRDGLSHDRQVDLLARLGVTVADAFIGCWHTKFKYDLVRPVTYIKRVIDPKWETLLITPPFPEYPSGHSTQSGAAEAVLTSFFGDNFAFEDKTHIRDGIAPRKFKSFHEAAEEAGISRLYGGIHFRAAIVQGLDQGRCIGKYAAALKTRN